MRAFPDDHFDRVICSRTVEELGAPNGVIAEALRVGRALTVGFVNHGYWKNRLDIVWSGRKPKNDVYTTDWHESRPANPATIADFEAFCALKTIRIARRVHLRGDWQTPCGSSRSSPDTPSTTSSAEERRECATTSVEVARRGRDGTSVPPSVSEGHTRRQSPLGQRPRLHCRAGPRGRA
jgi:hypothetical protein